MEKANPVADLLAAMIYDTYWGNRWHRIASATEGLEEEDLAYLPLPCMGSPRAILWYVATSAGACGNGLAPRTDDPAEAEWNRVKGRGTPTAADLVNTVDVACRRLHARARSLTDRDLCQGSRGSSRMRKGVLDRAQEFLVEHVARATEEQIERTYPMHHGVPHTGWQVASAMAQHDAWHAGQIALMRAAYRWLWDGARGESEN